MANKKSDRKVDEILACPKCGSKNLSTAKSPFMPDAIFGTSNHVCDDCSNIGLPILFDTEGDYEKFLKAKRNGTFPIPNR